jgi:hypothetical protein
VDVRTLTEQALAEATGRAHRDDEVLPGAGGPAGNARLTAWVGLVLLLAFGAELVTLLDVRGLMSWHVAIGIALIPPALLKTGTTGWRIVRYYTGNRPYRRAGPPPLLLRVLGPLVVLTTLGVLASGVLLIVLGAPASRQPMLTVSGHTVDATSLHKAAFLVWAGVTGLHVIGRLLPALQMTIARRLGPYGPPRPPDTVPGGVRRGGAVTVTVVLAVVAAVMTLAAVDLTAWHNRAGHDRPARVSSR